MKVKQLEQWKEKTKNWENILYYSALVGTLSHFRNASRMAKRDGLPLQALDLSPRDRLLLQDIHADQKKRDKLQFELEIAESLFDDWINDYNPIFLDFEKVCYSQVYIYAGTGDIICKIDGKKYLVDMKSNPRLLDKFELQATAYAYAFIEMGEEIEEVAVLSIPPRNSKYMEYKFYKVYDQFPTFLKYRQLFREQFGI